MLYSSFGILSLPLYLIINHRVFRSAADKSTPAPKVRYRYFLYSVVLYLLTDIMWGFTYEWHIMLPVYIDTIVYFFFMGLSVLLWTKFVVAYLNNSKKLDRILAGVGWVVFAFVILCLVVNQFIPVVFKFEADGTYIPMPARYSFLGAQILLFAMTALHSFSIAIKTRGVDRSYLTVALSGVVMTTFCILQTLDPFLPFYAIGCLVSAVFIHTFVGEEEELEKQKMLADALEEAEKANEAKTVFLSNMSHEIRTPINAILGMNEIIRRDCSDNKVLECADNIHNAGTSLLGIISDILDFSKIEAGKLEIFNDEYKTGEMLEDIYNMIRLRAEAKGLDLVFKIDPEIPRRLKGDELRIKQVLTNLLTNAVKYTEKGSITFFAGLLSKGSGHAKLNFSVSDTGIGIREEEQEKLFSAFDRLDEKRTRNIEGTGLGLAITSSLLGMMGTKLRVKSTYNVGSEFSFDLDQEIVEETAIGVNWMDTMSSEKQVKRSGGITFTAPECRVLLVDDTPLNLAVICGLLEPSKIMIDTADSGAQCILKFGSKDYDLVFLDYRMPIMDGIETLTKLKEQHPEKAGRIPIISLTASAIAGEREHMLGAGFTDYLTKPVIISEMNEMLLKYLPSDKVQVIDTSEGEEQGISLDGVPKGLMEIPWLDVKEGVEYCGTVDMYLRGMEMFAKGIGEKATYLEERLAENDIENFTVKVHALKSTSRTMGMNAFSERARELELAAKGGDLQLIRGKFPGFVSDYRGMSDALQNAMGQ